LRVRLDEVVSEAKGKGSVPIANAKSPSSNQFSRAAAGARGGPAAAAA
jgi:hypothetical protein